MTATADRQPSSPPSLDNPLTMGFRLWRVICPRCGYMLECGTVTDLNHHFAEIRTSVGECGGFRRDWIDARDPFTPWHRSKREAALKLLGFPDCFGPLTQIAQALYRKEKNRDSFQRPKAWAAILKPTQGDIHPRTIAAAFRRLATLGLAVRAPGRRGRWKTLTEPLP